jgi:TonB-linked SusC/RagA family outer membrane protein
MKKKQNHGDFRANLLKIIRIMRLCLFLILLGTAMAYSADSYSQNAKLRLNLTNATVKEVIKAIEDQSEFIFFYQDQHVDLNRRVNIRISNKTIEEVLNDLFAETGNSYIVRDRQIVIGKVDRQTEENLPLMRRIIEPVEQQQQPQRREITGSVRDDKGLPLPGVSVVVKGTTSGTITGSDGTFMLQVPTNTNILVFSFVGMGTQEVNITGTSAVSVVLTEEMLGIDEVIAVGYQTKYKANLTGSVATVDLNKLENRPTARLANLLAGTTPGLTVTRSNPGRIGTSVDGIRIGGIVSRNEPGVLVVLDGIPQESVGVLNQINPNDVASISILKDAEAAVYGARAAGGVIVITTKRGESKSKIGFGVTKEFNIPHIYRQTTNMFEMFEMQDEGWKNNNASFFGYPDLFKFIKDNNITFDMIKGNDFKYVYGLNAPGTWAPFPDTPFLGFGHTDWMDLMYGTGVKDHYDLNISGISEKTNYYVSLGMVDEGSMLQYGENKSMTGFLRSKFEYNHNDFIKAGTNIALRYQNWVEPSRYDFMQNLISQKFTFDHPFTPEGRYMNWGGYQNPIGVARDGGEATRRYYNIQAQMYVEVRPIKDLIINANIVKYANFTNVRSVQKEFMHYYWDETPTWGSLGQLGQFTRVDALNQFNQSFSGNLTAKYKFEISNDHVFNALVGVSHEEFENDQTNAWRLKLLSESLATLNLGNSQEQYNSDAITHNALESFFANMSYAFRNKYIIEGNYRSDGSSRFAAGYKWKDFYSASAAWNITNEKFVQDLSLNALNNLKFRISWGQLGNQAGIALYDFVQQVNIGQSSILLGPSASPVKAQIATISGFPALDRTWEIAEKTNLGADIAMFDSRLNIVGNYFITDNSNIFYTEEFPQVLGATPPSINGARVKTKGWDFGLGWNDQVNNELQYNINFGISDANTKVISLADRRNISYGNNGFVEGYPVGTVFGFQFDGFIEDEAALANYRSAVSRTPWALTSQLIAGDARFKDLDGDGIVEAAPYTLDENGNPTPTSGDMVALGDLERHYEYFVNGGINYRGFDLSFVLTGVGKWLAFDQTGVNYGYPWIQPLKHFSQNTWTPEKRDAFYPRMSVISVDFSNHRNNNNYGLSDAHYMRRNVPYLAVKNIKLGYTIPQNISSLIRSDKIYLFVNATDLGYIVNKVPKSYSPEQPFNASLTPYPRTFSVGLNINF